jgi:hypothetical protein
MALKPKQMALIEAMIAHPTMSDVKLGELLNLNNKTVGVYKKNPEFQEELSKRLKEKWKESERIAQDTMIRLATEGDFKASKFILESLGYAPTQNVKLEADVNQDINIFIEE